MWNTKGIKGLLDVQKRNMCGYFCNNSVLVAQYLNVVATTVDLVCEATI